MRSVWRWEMDRRLLHMSFLLVYGGAEESFLVTLRGVGA
jgi:hypothetical protein